MIRKTEDLNRSIVSSEHVDGKYHLALFFLRFQKGTDEEDRADFVFMHLQLQIHELSLQLLA